MNRRRFITVLGGAAWPFTARAQESSKLRLVGIFYYSRVDDPITMAEIAAFKEALQRLGWGAGRNVRFEDHLNVLDSVARRKRAKELVALKADVILTGGTPATAAVF